MKKKLDVHRTDERLKSTIKGIDVLSNTNKELLMKFHDECFSRGLSNARVLFYLIKLKKIAEKYKKDLDKLTIEDIKNIVSDIEKNDFMKEKEILSIIGGLLVIGFLTWWLLFSNTKEYWGTFASDVEKLRNDFWSGVIAIGFIALIIVIVVIIIWYFYQREGSSSA